MICILMIAVQRFTIPIIVTTNHITTLSSLAMSGFTSIPIIVKGFSMFFFIGLPTPLSVSETLFKAHSLLNNTYADRFRSSYQFIRQQQSLELVERTRSSSSTTATIATSTITISPAQPTRTSTEHINYTSWFLLLVTIL